MKKEDVVKEVESFIEVAGRLDRVKIQVEVLSSDDGDFDRLSWTNCLDLDVVVGDDE